MFPVLIVAVAVFVPVVILLGLALLAAGPMVDDHTVHRPGGFEDDEPWRVGGTGQR